MPRNKQQNMTSRCVVYDMESYFWILMKSKEQTYILNPSEKRKKRLLDENILIGIYMY